MKYLALLVALFAFSTQASASGDCFSMARNYLMAVDQSQPVKMINNKRQQFVEVCRMDKSFTRTLTQREARGDAGYAIHDNQYADYYKKSTYRM